MSSASVPLPFGVVLPPCHAVFESGKNAASDFWNEFEQGTPYRRRSSR
jgi:hypothetical protein